MPGISSYAVGLTRTDSHHPLLALDTGKPPSYIPPNIYNYTVPTDEDAPKVIVRFRDPSTPWLQTREDETLLEAICRVPKGWCLQSLFLLF